MLILLPEYILFYWYVFANAEYRINYCIRDFSIDMTHICPHLKLPGPFQATKGTSFKFRFPHPHADLFIYLFIQRRIFMSALGAANSLTLTRIQGTLKDILAQIHEYRGCFAIKTWVLVMAKGPVYVCGVQAQG